MGQKFVSRHGRAARGWRLWRRSSICVNPLLLNRLRRVGAYGGKIA